MKKKLLLRIALNLIDYEPQVLGLLFWNVMLKCQNFEKYVQK